MINEINAAATALGISCPSLASEKVGKLYEILMIFELALAIKGMGVSVEPRSHQGKPTAVFYFRGNPGHIPKTTATTLEPSYFFFVRQSGAALELHNSLEYRGHSGAEHEVDVSVVPSDRVDKVRSRGGGPVDGLPYALVELKYFTKGTTLPKNAIRSVFACAFDLSPSWLVKEVELRMRNGTVTYQTRNYSEEVHLVTSAKISQSTKKFGDFYGIDLHEHVGTNGDFTGIKAVSGQLAFELI